MVADRVGGIIVVADRVGGIIVVADRVGGIIVVADRVGGIIVVADRVGGIIVVADRVGGIIVVADRVGGIIVVADGVVCGLHTYMATPSSIFVSLYGEGLAHDLSVDHSLLSKEPTVEGVSGDTSNITLSDLCPFTNYTVSVFASTAEGPGPAGNVSFTTKPAGKLSNILTVYYH